MRTAFALDNGDGDFLLPSEFFPLSSCFVSYSFAIVFYAVIASERVVEGENEREREYRSKGEAGELAIKNAQKVCTPN